MISKTTICVSEWPHIVFYYAQVISESYPIRTSLVGGARIYCSYSCIWLSAMDHRMELGLVWKYILIRSINLDQQVGRSIIYLNTFLLSKVLSIYVHSIRMKLLLLLFWKGRRLGYHDRFALPISSSHPLTSPRTI